MKRLEFERAVDVRSLLADAKSSPARKRAGAWQIASAIIV